MFRISRTILFAKQFSFFFLLFSEQYFREPCVALFRFFPFIIHTGVINIHDASMSVSFGGKQDIDVHKRGYMYRRISKITEPKKNRNVKKVLSLKWYTDRASNNDKKKKERKKFGKEGGLNCPWRTWKSVKRNGVDTAEITFRDRNWKLLAGMSGVS